MPGPVADTLCFSPNVTKKKDIEIEHVLQGKKYPTKRRPNSRFFRFPNQGKNAVTRAKQLENEQNCMKS